MAQTRVNTGLLVSIAASALLHATVIVPVWMVAMRAPQSSPRVDSQLSPDDPAITPPPASQPELGLDAPNPSSLTWIGYEEYEQHIAALAEVDQAAFTEHIGAEPSEPQVESQPEALPETQPVSPPDAEPVEQIEPQAQPEPEPVPAVVEPELIPQPEPLPQQPLESEPLETQSVEPTVGDRAWVQSLLESLTEQFQRAPITAPQEIPHEEDIDEADEAAEPTDAVEPSDAAQDTEPREPTSPRVAPQPAQSPGESSGEPSDRESDATSTIEAEPQHWREGKPLAAHGVELRTRRPEFTLLTRMTASPGNPLVLIRFQSDGTPQSAEFVEGSGSASVDAAIEASLYRWRARGDAIDALSDNQTFDVTIRIVLNPRAPR
jgi:hypothetical protein